MSADGHPYDHDHDHSQDHAHDHAHGHDAHEPLVIEDEAGNIEGQILVAALQALLVERNLVAPGEVRREIERIESPGVHLGAKIVARAWIDDDFRRRLLADGKSAVAELGIGVGEAQLIVVENDPATHNLVCCTLCSCYPRSILGQPPAWYISKAYRARAVREPRAVLKEFGLELPAGVQLVVHDSNADMRYLVLPQRPEGTDDLDEAALADLVTRDCMIGVAVLPAA
ncbi:nitrile hydratase subunit alpha [Xanthobacter sp. KR7-65]|uniref:nitrile hydratase subunit alpha n=1 Tax=Xanthobacter sp. KR7-65 TaxID=3156612 RepID=UPI0032B5BD20